MDISEAEADRLKTITRRREERGHGGGLVDDLEAAVAAAGLHVPGTLEAADQTAAGYTAAAHDAGDKVPDWLVTSIIRAFISRGELSLLPYLRADFGEQGPTQKIGDKLGSTSFTAGEMILARLAVIGEALQR